MGLKTLNRTLVAYSNLPCQIQGGVMVRAWDSSLWLTHVSNAITEARSVFVCVGAENHLLILC